MPKTDWQPKFGGVVKRRGIMDMDKEEGSTQEFMQTKNIAKLAEALAKAQLEITGARKTSENPFLHKNYADLASVWDACRQPLSKNGLAVTQLLSNNDSQIIVTTMLLHLSGEWIKSEMSFAPDKADIQAAGKIITYLRRYALAAIVGVAQVDDDGEDLGTGKVKKPTDKPPKKADKNKFPPADEFDYDAAEDRIRKCTAITELDNVWKKYVQIFYANNNILPNEYEALKNLAVNIKANILDDLKQKNGKPPVEEGTLEWYKEQTQAAHNALTKIFPVRFTSESLREACNKYFGKDSIWKAKKEDMPGLKSLWEVLRTEVLAANE